MWESSVPFFQSAFNPGLFGALYSVSGAFTPLVCFIWPGENDAILEFGVSREIIASSDDRRARVSPRCQAKPRRGSLQL